MPRLRAPRRRRSGGARWAGCAASCAGSGHATTSRRRKASSPGRRWKSSPRSSRSRSHEVGNGPPLPRRPRRPRLADRPLHRSRGGVRGGRGRAGAGVTEVAEMQSQRAVAQERRTLRGLFVYFLKLGSWGFGGPIALCGYMRRDLVENRRWYSDDEYRQGLAIAQTMPGPLAAQLAMWLGYLERGSLGAAVVSIPFVVPSFLLVTTIGVVYAKYQGLAVVEDVF